MQVAPILLALALALAVPSSSAEWRCNLMGTWINDLGSTMTINDVNSKGEFDGSYTTAVSASKSPIQKSPLQGFQHYNEEQPTFGFTVKWTFSDSITVFTGQCFVDKDGNEVLKTMWLLRQNVDNLEDDWKATRVGVNTFTRLERRMEL